MIKSIRWKLMLWYATVLCTTAALFATLLYVNVRRSVNEEVDRELRSQATELANVLLPAGQNTFVVDLTSEQAEYFGMEGADATHYAIWKGDGELIDASHPLLELPRPKTIGIRDRGHFRELIIRGPADTWIAVGKNTERGQRQLRSIVVSSLLVGGASLALMLAGGWFLTGRALAPIKRISQAASAVSASNLSERIDITRMEWELAELAETINAAFDRLQESFEQQTRFTADASHELRTPLSIVLSHADFALKAPRGDTEYQEALTTIRRAAQRMKSVVEGLLSLARADAGQVQLAVERVDLRDLVDETCRLYQGIATEKQVQIQTKLEPVMVLGDHDRLCEAIANLLNNGVKYNQPGGQVEVSVAGNHEKAVLQIADTGPGIPEADRPHIFDRFYRADKSRSRSVDGNGLGLAITKWIVEAHGGSLSCRPNLSVGTVFTVILDRA